MKTTYMVGIKELAELLEIASDLEDNNWKIANWILDVLGLPPESDHDWNALTELELNAGFSGDGMVLCCRDSMHELWLHKSLDRESALSVVASWVEAIRIMEQPNGARTEIVEQFLKQK